MTWIIQLAVLLMQNYVWLYIIYLNRKLNGGILIVWFPPEVKESNPCFLPLILRAKVSKQNSGVQKKSMFSDTQLSFMKLP